MKGWLFYIVGTGLITYGVAKWNTSKYGNEGPGISIFFGILFILGGIFYSFLT